MNRNDSMRLSRREFTASLAALPLAMSAVADAAPPKEPPPHNPVEPIPVNTAASDAPAWLAPFRLRYALQIGGDRTKSPAKSIMAALPTGGRLRPDASDISVVAATGERLPVTVLSHDPLGSTLIQFPRRGDAAWYYAFAVAPDGAALPAAIAAEAKPAHEGLSVEIRKWAGEDLGDWSLVREGLQSSKNVIGNALVAEVIENCNPVRPNDPRNYASGYRGFLKIETDGVYRFFLNAEDSAFLFIDGFKVTERVGTNARITGAVKLREIGDEVELKAGVHPFEVHHVMGNNPTAIGYCALMWAPPDAKTWAYVPYKQFAQADYGRVAAVDEAKQTAAATFAFGIDDTLRSGDGELVYLVDFAAVGPSKPAAAQDPNSLVWDFGDGTTGRGLRATHVYFQGGDYTVTLTSGDLPPYRANVHIWPAPGNTSPRSLAKTVAALRDMEWPKLDADRLNRMFQFLLVCEQVERWPLIDKVTEKLLAEPGLELKQQVVVHRTRMQSLAHQGKGDEAIALGEKILTEFGRVPSLQVGIRLEIAQIYHRHLKKFDEAAGRYEKIVNENRRVEHPDVRVAAIRWGDLYAETGDLRRAGECYRMANTLGGQAFAESSLTGAMTRGGLLRMAEQRLKAGDIQQTRQLLERIELNYPEEKLEGLYRLLRADADRRTGRYDDALRNYEILLKLSQWSGFHDRALHGLADTYFRLGSYDKAVEWLDSLEKSFPRFYEKQKLADFRKLVVERQARAAALAAQKQAGTAEFADIVCGFEPEEKEAWGTPLNFKVGSGLGIVGPHVGVGINFPTYAGYFDMKRVIPVLTGGEYWVEMWYREMLMPLNLAPHIHMYLRDEKNSADVLFQGTSRVERSYGGWRKIGFPMQVTPAAASGYSSFTIRQVAGVFEFDGMAVHAVTDHESDALNNFLKGADTE
jgi:tetratricopeptide (TPR) repeat protein